MHEGVPSTAGEYHVADKNGWQENPRIQAVARAEEELAPLGRLFVRASGTEPLIRILGEHPDADTLQKVLEPVVRTIEQEQGGSRAS